MIIKPDSSDDFRLPRDTVLLLNRDSAGSPAVNMASDEELFRSLDPLQPVLAVRSYTWDRPSISIGRFQDPVKSFDLDKIMLENIGFVRRITGGRGVFHPDGPEGLTCSFACSRALFPDFGKRRVFHFIHGLFTRVFLDLGIRSRVAERPEKHGPSSIGRADCFDSPSEFELVSEEGVKLMGSAQFEDERGILQQTSIPLGPGVRRLSDYELRPFLRPSEPSPLYGADPERLITLFLNALEESGPHSGIRSRPRDSLRIREMADTRYSRDEWNIRKIIPEGALPV